MSLAHHFVLRNLTDAVEGFFSGKRHQIHDRGPLYTWEFIELIAGCGIEAISIRRALCDQRIVLGPVLFGKDALRNAVREFVTRHHTADAHPDG